MIAAVVLAAGRASRFGGPKQLLVHRGRPLVRIAVEAVLAAGCDPVLVVVGAHAEPVLAAIADLPAEPVTNDSWELGMSSSIRRGVERAAGDPRIEGVLLTACDLPQLDARVVRALLAAARRSPEATGIAACAYAGTIGLPVIFPRSCFDRLTALEGDRGAKEILLREGAAVTRVDWPAGAEDVDHGL